VESRWKGYRDSIVNNNYDLPDGGYPIPGVIHNPPGDYWNFLSNGDLDAVINGNHYSVTFSYSGSNQLTIYDPPTDPADIYIITQLTDSTFIFFYADTSRLGGTYYRQVWLKK
jgi:hypothetical protein